MLVLAAGQSIAGALPVAGAMIGALGIVCAAFAVFLAGPSLLIHASRWLAVLGLGVSGLGALANLVAGTSRPSPGRGGPGSLLASAGMVLLAFGAARVAERRRLAKRRAQMERSPPRA